MNDRWALVAVAGFTVAISAYGYLVNSPFTTIYLVVMLVIVALVYSIHRSSGFSPGLVGWLVALGFAHLMGGVFLIAGEPLYEYRPVEGLPRYDQILHTFGTGVAAAAMFQLVPQWAGNPNLSRVGHAGLAWLAALGLGALVELVEFVGVLNIPNTNVGDYTNTGWDLVANTIGASVVVLVASIRRTVNAPSSLRRTQQSSSPDR